MKGGKYAKNLAKIQVKGTFRIRDIRRNVLPKFIEINCVETPCYCPSGWAPDFWQLDDIFEPSGQNEPGMEIEQCVFLFFSPQPPCGRVRLARFARLRLLTYTNPILRKEPTVLQPSAKSAVSCESAQFRWEDSTHRPRPPGTRSEQFSCARVTEFSLTSLFLEQFWRELTISFRSHKPNIKTKNP